MAVAAGLDGAVVAGLDRSAVTAGLNCRGCRDGWCGRERWVGSGLLVAEKQFRRVQGHKQIPVLLRELEALIPSKSEVVKRRKAS